MRPGAARLDIAERRALETVAIVDQQTGLAARRGFGALLGDQAGHARQPDGRIGPVGIIVVPQQVTVQIRRGEHAQPPGGPGGGLVHRNRHVCSRVGT